MASLVSTYYIGTVGSRYAISHSRSGSHHDSSKRGSNELKLLPWTLPEVKRLLWTLLWSTLPTLFTVWHWSIWRRRKQERARQCHYQRHAQRTRPREQLPLATQAEQTTYPTNLSDQQWAAAQQVIPVHRVGRPCTIDLRQVLNAMCYTRVNHCSSANVTSRIPGKSKPCLLTCIAGSDREYGRAFLKLSELLKSDGTGRISAVVILSTV